MSLRYKFKKANRIIEKLAPADLLAARTIAAEIQKAQDALLQKADGHFNRCVSICKGLCCQNIQIDQIIGLWDFVYVLLADRSAAGLIQSCLNKENRLFTADCIFLEDGKGPCLFAFNVRPEVCITTFCTSVKPVDKEIRTVKRKFVKLYLYILFARVRAMVNIILKPLIKRESKQKSG